MPHESASVFRSHEATSNTPRQAAAATTKAAAATDKAAAAALSPDGQRGSSSALRQQEIRVQKSTLTTSFAYLWRFICLFFFSLYLKLDESILT